MRVIRMVVMLYVVLGGLSGEASLFSDIDRSFWVALQPQNIEGFWAGRCVHVSEPNSPWPAVYVQKTINNPNHFPPSYSSQSYYWERNTNLSLFDELTSTQVENYPAVKSWFEREQWTSIQVQEHSFKNYYIISETLKIRRSVRVYEDEFNEPVIARISKIEKSGDEEVVVYCYFPKHLDGDTFTSG